MCIYCGTTKYRKIYEQHNGPIPKDEIGRSYEIHHIDGNHSNNDLSNLKCVSIKEHYDIHYSQKDWMACHRLSYRMNLSIKEISDLARKGAKFGKDNYFSNNVLIGKEHPSYDHTVYCWEHTKTKEQLNLTRQEFIIKTGASPATVSMLITKSRKTIVTVNDYRIIDPTKHNDDITYKNRGKVHSRFDNTLYTWFNTLTDEVVTMHRYDFIRQYNISEQSVYNLIKGLQKTASGWKLLP